jgi:oligopeptide transport system permease protein
VVSLSPATHDPTECSLRATDGSYQDRLAPSAEHWFGTDEQGCDEFARVIYGARSSLMIGLAAASLMTLVGTALGVAAGCGGGFLDAVVRRVGDVTLGIPLVVGAILLLSVLAGDRREPLEIAFALAALGWPGAARSARTATRSIMVQPYIEAARALGAGMPTWCATRSHP